MKTYEVLLVAELQYVSVCDLDMVHVQIRVGVVWLMLKSAATQEPRVLEMLRVLRELEMLKVAGVV